MNVKSNGGMILTGKREEYGRKTCSTDTQYTTNPIWIGMRANPVLHGERPVTNHLNHDTPIRHNSVMAIYNGTFAFYESGELRQYSV
jgi:hypothetical protein